MTPNITAIIEITSAIKIVGMKFFLNWRAVITGITRRAEMRRTPTIGIESEIVAAVRIAKIVFMRFTLIPLTCAASWSKVR